MKKSIVINITKKDLATLDKYGFYIEKNIESYLHEIAEEIRACEASQQEQKKT